MTMQDEGGDVKKGRRDSYLILSKEAYTGTITKSNRLKHYKMFASRTVSHDINYSLDDMAFLGGLKIQDLSALIRVTS